MSKKKNAPAVMPAYAVRIDAEKVAQAKRLGVDIPTVFRDALDRAIMLTVAKCPTCGQRCSILQQSKRVEKT